MDSESVHRHRFQDFENPPRRSRMRQLILAASLVLAFPLTQSAGAAAATPAQQAPFVMGMDADESTYAGKWMRMVYAEAFKRLEIPVSFDTFSSKRLSFLVDDGVIDGDAARIHGYGALHPKLVRVDVSTMEFKFSLYAASPKVNLRRLEDLPSSKLLVEFRRGLGICEQALKPLLPPAMISDVTSATQGVKKLLAGRTDLYCENDATMLHVLHTPEFKDAAGVRAVLDLGNPIETYPYLHQKRTELVPRLTATLKQMKVEGLIEAYRLQAQRELGWIP